LRAAGDGIKRNANIVWFERSEDGEATEYTVGRIERQYQGFKEFFLSRQYILKVAPRGKRSFAYAGKLLMCITRVQWTRLCCSLCV
jgi:hypothetical protein